MSHRANWPSSAPASLKAALSPCSLAAALRWISPHKAEEATGILIAAGFDLLEVRLNSSYLLNGIEQLVRRFHAGALIGAGV
ncbi:hypothetical protein [Rhizobium hainanense]|uniref:2-dehydro-3-deoxy-6-phosphogalactonate aldolase n=1 Tax=Rhizobium hainanense TaxID=52131 RepID=A0A1C3W831_9HYPH|nr:hypothetical protein [Rhizobium hainanense]SCB36133.1 hypothetical protein GA0061100_1138 [Rhizobium hainanense]